ncbi:MAG TPA: hypothetical protein VL588_05650 [Bdellovibrionota bacterium]|nr:hypothetical protein [Bdellovibrionota bacterium]
MAHLQRSQIHLISASLATGILLLLSGCMEQGQGPSGSTQQAAPGKPAVESIPAQTPAAPGGSKPTHTAAPSSPEVAKAPAPAAPVIHDDCHVVTFKHQDLASHRDGEACLHHRNLLKIPAERLNGRSVCVRVNNKPVKFALDKKHAGQILIPAVAGPESVISVSYCTGKLTCAEDCKVPKDEFLAAIGGADDGGAGFGGGSEDAALEKELKALNGAAGGGSSNAAFAGWITQGEPKAACGDAHVASRK